MDSEVTSQARVEASEDWLGQQFDQLRERVQANARELAQLRTALDDQRSSAGDLHEALAVVEGRTRRHEAGQDAVQGLQREIGALADRLEDEVSLLRDRGSAVDRERHVEREQIDTGLATLTSLAMRMDRLEERVGSELQLRRQAQAHEPAPPEVDTAQEARLVAIERALGALTDQLHRGSEDLSRVEALAVPLTSNIDTLQTRTSAVAEEQRRMVEDIASLRADRGREDELLEVIEQQRSTRQRLEQRLNELEERIEATLQELAAAHAEQLQLRHTVAGAEERMRSLAEALEGQRWATIEHYRQLLQAEDEHGRKEIEEIERRLRSSRSLLVRLTERSEQVSQEQPL